MKVALIHDYLKEFGGAERVLRVLADMYPDAPIYTAFKVKNSTAGKAFSDRKIIESWLAPILKIWKLYSPLRFLIPAIWGSMSAKGGSAYGRDLSDYDLVITSASWYITRGFKVGKNTKVICYCHTPPRWLYGYETSVGFTKYWPVKIYSAIVGHFLRMYDFKMAQPVIREKSRSKFRAGVDIFIANSENVKSRIEKFYRRDSVVIYPPVDVERIRSQTSEVGSQREEYFLIVARLVGAKGLEAAVKAFSRRSKSHPKDGQLLADKYNLKIVGEAHGFSDVQSKISKVKSANIEFLGRVSDEKLWELYAKAKGFIALSRDEDFGMTPVEAQAAGTPVIAFNGGGYKESVLPGVTGLLINDTDEKTITEAIERFEKIKWDKKKLQENAMRFSKERFEKEMKKLVSSIMN